MTREPKRTCPMLRKRCIEEDCMLWMKLKGENPQDGEKVDEFGCAVVWQVITQIEGAKESRMTAKYVESLRNEVAQANQTMINIQISANQKFMEAIRLMGAFMGGKVELRPPAPPPSVTLEAERE